MNPPRRGVCHQCGRSFELRPMMTGAEGSASGDASGPFSEPWGGLACPHCGSEFVELLEPKRARSREARAEVDPHSGSEYDDGDGDGDGGEPTDMGVDDIIDGTWYGHGEHHDPRRYHGHHPLPAPPAPHRYPAQGVREGGGSGSFIIHSFPGGILLRGGAIPVALSGRSLRGSHTSDAGGRGTGHNAAAVDDDYAAGQLSFAEYQVVRLFFINAPFYLPFPAWAIV